MKTSYSTLTPLTDEDMANVTGGLFGFVKKFVHFLGEAAHFYGEVAGAFAGGVFGGLVGGAIAGTAAAPGAVIGGTVGAELGKKYPFLFL